MFAFLFGYTFIPYENSDIVRYKEYYEIVMQFTGSDYIQQILSTYSPASAFQDVYLVSLMFLTSFFGASFKIFIGVQAVIYFSFFIGILNIIYDQLKNVGYKKYILFLLGCVFIYSFAAGVNGIRFPTAFMVFMYFTLKYMFNPKLKYVLLAGLSCLIHISLLQPFLGLLLFLVISSINNNYLKFFLIGLIVVMFFSLNLQQVSQVVDNEIVSKKIQDYTNENYISQREEHTQNWNWYIQFNQYSNYYFLIIAMFLSAFQLKMNFTTKRFFLIALIFLIISMYYEIYLDSISNRFRQFFEFFALIYLILLFAFNNDSRFTRITRRSYSFILLFTILISLRSLSYNLDLIRLSISPLINLLEFDSTNLYYFL